MSQPPPKKELLFGKGLMDPTLAGDKTWTLRHYRPEAHELRVGEIVVGVFADGLRILLQILEDTRIKTFGEVTQQEAELWGYDDPEEVLEMVSRYYPNGLTSSDTLAAIHFQVARIDGTPVVAWNDTQD